AVRQKRERAAGRNLLSADRGDDTEWSALGFGRRACRNRRRVHIRGPQSAAPLPLRRLREQAFLRRLAPAREVPGAVAAPFRPRHPGLRPAGSTRATSVPTSSSLCNGQHAVLVDETNDRIEPLPRLELRQYEGPLTAHLPRVA